MFSTHIQNQTAEVFSSIGKQLLVEIIGNQANVSHLANGFYTLVANNGKQSIAVKFVKN